MQSVQSEENFIFESLLTMKTGSSEETCTMFTMSPAFPEGQLKKNLIADSLWVFLKLKACFKRDFFYLHMMSFYYFENTLYCWFFKLT